ncbi:bifunctional riboflavin kinase/FAD synthetase [Exilibacterium tricleocarpae]|uniref:Riboflavin biosynthesis protein n=1 Tax=Exilibacterium tricleocarpae TaxID=2591008 RepID=A0A545T1V3_9GAMM|nr:bifunctional riboflavin kinase/FAD synthetase [Exilibacterium tricleocarpae]TQV71191.1 bifunctional riboflavin kinase/FAD synthetase [Exilibacterium tricleocarpae]
MPPQREIIRGLHNLRPHHGGCVATIGSFDGVHRGHQVIIGQVTDKARELGKPSVAVVFEPQPTEYFMQSQAPARLMRFREKAEALFDAGVERVLCLYFNDALRLLSGAEFVRQVVIERLRPDYMVVGDDFQFGRDRTGGIGLLREAGAAHGFTVADTHTFAIDGERVSSTRIRKLLAAGDFRGAARLLGKPYRLTGRVIHGRQLGRQLGVPTANVLLHRHRSPLQGVYAVEVAVAGDTAVRYRGVANVGVRPTVAHGSRPVLETHLFDFGGDLYGRRLLVTFRQKLREEQRFASVDLLKDQIHRDIETARTLFEAGL